MLRLVRRAWPWISHAHFFFVVFFRVTHDGVVLHNFLRIPSSPFLRAHGRDVTPSSEMQIHPLKIDIDLSRFVLMGWEFFVLADRDFYRSRRPCIRRVRPQYERQSKPQAAQALPTEVHKEGTQYVFLWDFPQDIHGGSKKRKFSIKMAYLNSICVLSAPGVNILPI